MAKPLLKEDMSEAEDANHFVIRCRGLPWSTTKDEVVNFFDECTFKNGEDSVHLTLTREGRPSGEAYIEVDTEEDMNKALEKDKAHMGKRYIEVFKSKFSEMEWVVKRSGKGDEGFAKGGDSDSVVRLRGLPFDSTKADIEKFFEGMEITNNGILMTSDYQGRSSGEAYVQFAEKGDVDKALEKNKQSIGHRYIEVFRSSMMEAQRAQYGGGGGRMGGGGYGGRGGRPGPYDRMGGAPLGRGFGAGGPGMRGRQMKSFGGNDGGYGGYGGNRGGGGGFGNYSEDFGPGGGGFGNGGGFGGGGGFGNGGGFGGGGGGFGGGGMGGGPSHVVHMRGLPFRVTENDICEWFSSVVDPTDISIMYNNQGRPTGEADVIFNTQDDAQRAMTKNRQYIGERYIELSYSGSINRYY